MGYLIDGFNLIYKFPHLEEMMYANELSQAQKGLIDILKKYEHIKKAEIRVVFDGKRKQGDNTGQEHVGKILVYYSHDYSADHLIKQFTKTNLNPRMTTVVTSDREIIFYVNRFRSPVIKSEDFARIVNREIEEYNYKYTPEKEDNPELSEDEISFWEKMFTKKKS